MQMRPNYYQHCLANNTFEFRTLLKPKVSVSYVIPQIYITIV